MKLGSIVVALVATCLSPLASAQTGPGTTGGQAVGQGTIGGIHPAALAALNLTEQQRVKVTEIQRELQRKKWGLIGSMRELRWKHEDALNAPDFDPELARNTFDAMAAVRRTMFEAGLDARKAIEAVLTNEQREQLRKRKGASAHAGDGFMGTETGPVPR